MMRSGRPREEIAPEIRARDRAIVDAYTAGDRLSMIAARFGISRQRVEQIARFHALPARRTPCEPVASVPERASQPETGEVSTTGEQLANQIRDQAEQLGVPLHTFVSPLSLQPKKWLYQLAQAQQPKPHTVARIAALLNGEDVPAPPPNSFQAPARRGERAQEPVVIVRRMVIADDAPEPINRNPCVGCGVRADRHAEFGCRHFLRSRLP